MRVGINEVLIYPRSSGAQKREMNVLPELLREIEYYGGISCVYFSQNLDSEYIAKLTAKAQTAIAIKTPLPSIPTYKRVLKGFAYWHNQVVIDRLDLFHTSYYPLPRLSIPSVFTVNDVRFLHLPHTYKRTRYWFLRLTSRSSLVRATRIIAISQDTKDDLVQLLGVSKDKIDVIPLAISSDFYPITDQGRLEKVRTYLNLPKSFVLFVGHLEPRKNLARLVQAYLKIRQKFDCKLVIVGKPEWSANKLLNQVRENSSEEAILFTGYVADEDLPALYNLASVVAFPSLHEGFGMPVLEAMACGTPVVTSNVSALPEVAGDAAVLVNPYDVESIADGIARVLKDDSLRKKLISKGFNRVKQFKPRDVATKIVETYKKALADHPLPNPL